MHVNIRTLLPLFFFCTVRLLKHGFNILDVRKEIWAASQKSQQRLRLEGLRNTSEGIQPSAELLERLFKC